MAQVNVIYTCVCVPYSMISLLFVVILDSNTSRSVKRVKIEYSSDDVNSSHTIIYENSED